jgi:hypothetical protein
MTKAAQEYLMAVDKKKKAMEARGGMEAGAAFVEEQKKIARQLSGDDNKFQAVAQKRLRNKATAARTRGVQNVRTEGPKSPFDKNKDYGGSKAARGGKNFFENLVAPFTGK